MSDTFTGRKTVQVRRNRPGIYERIRGFTICSRGARGGVLRVRLFSGQDVPGAGGPIWPNNSKKKANVNSKQAVEKHPYTVILNEVKDLKRPG